MTGPRVTPEQRDYATATVETWITEKGIDLRRARTARQAVRVYQNALDDPTTR